MYPQGRQELAPREARATPAAPQQTRASNGHGANDGRCTRFFSFIRRYVLACLGLDHQSSDPDSECDMAPPGKHINSVSNHESAFYRDGQVDLLPPPPRIRSPPILSHLYSNMVPPNCSPRRRMLPRIPPHFFVPRSSPVNQGYVPPTKHQLDTLIRILKKIKEQEIRRSQVHGRRLMPGPSRLLESEELSSDTDITWPETLAKLNRVVLELEADVTRTQRLQKSDEDTGVNNTSEHDRYMDNARAARRHDKFRKRVSKNSYATYLS